MNPFKDLWEQWKIDWVERRIVFLVELVGTILNMTASTLMGFMSSDPPLIVIMALWIVGSIALVYTNYMRRIAWPLILMSFYTFMNIVGFYNLVV
jgi:protein-S-isoprenylcysteine O-methyltransferase Ste14